MKIASFNANGIRARMPILLNWLKKESPDVLCIQETKVQDHEFPSQPLEDVGYHCSFKGQKSYNGVAILSKKKPNNISTGFGDGDEKEARGSSGYPLTILRLLTLTFPKDRIRLQRNLIIRSNGFHVLEDISKATLSRPHGLYWAGDFNVAPKPVDVYDPDKLLGTFVIILRSIKPKRNNGVGIRRRFQNA